MQNPPAVKGYNPKSKNPVRRNERSRLIQGMLGVGVCALDFILREAKMHEKRWRVDMTTLNEREVRAMCDEHFSAAEYMEWAHDTYTDNGKPLNFGDFKNG